MIKIMLYTAIVIAINCQSIILLGSDQDEQFRIFTDKTLQDDTLPIVIVFNKAFEIYADAFVALKKVQNYIDEKKSINTLQLNLPLGSKNFIPLNQWSDDKLQALSKLSLGTITEFELSDHSTKLVNKHLIELIKNSPSIHTLIFRNSKTNLHNGLLPAYSLLDEFIPLSAIETGVHNLTFDKVFISNSLAKTLSILLEKEDMVQSLRFLNGNISLKDFKLICDSIKKMGFKSALRELATIRMDGLGLSPDDIWETLSDLLIHNQNLITLNIDPSSPRRTNVNDSFISLCKSIQNHPALAYVTLNINRISLTQIKALAGLIIKNHGIERLNLIHYTDPTLEGITELLNAMQENPKTAVFVQIDSFKAWKPGVKEIYNQIKNEYKIHHKTLLESIKEKPLNQPLFFKK